MGPCIIGKTHRFSVPKHLQTLRKIPVYKICKSLDFFFFIIYILHSLPTFLELGLY